MHELHLLANLFSPAVYDELSATSNKSYLREATLQANS